MHTFQLAIILMAMHTVIIVSQLSFLFSYFIGKVKMM